MEKCLSKFSFKSCRKVCGMTFGCVSLPSSSSPEWPDPNTIPTVPYKGQIINALVYSVYDGDTCSILVPTGIDGFLNLRIRILGVDTPEVKVKKKDREEMGNELADLEEEAGKYVRDKVKQRIEGKVCKIRLDKWDKYGGRVIGEIFLESRRYSTLTNYLLTNYYAKPYTGQKKELWTEQELNIMLQKK